MKKIILSAILFCNVTILDAQWTQYNGLNGGQIFKIFEQGSDLIIQSADRIYLSSDNGENWTQIFNGFEGKNKSLVSVNDNNIYMETEITADGDHLLRIRDLYCSTDKGNSWFPTGGGIEDSQYVRYYYPPEGGCREFHHYVAKIETFVHSGENMFVGKDVQTYTEMPKVLRSTNNGISWDTVYTDSSQTPKSNGTPESNYFLDMKVSGTSIFALTSMSVVRSTDNGTTWEKLTIPNFLYSSRRELVVNDSFLFIMASGLPSVLNRKVFYSTNNGDTWAEIQYNGLANYTDYIFSGINSYGNNIYLADYSGLYLSTDTAKSWTNIGTELKKPYISVIIANENGVYVNSGGGLLLSSDYGLTWTEKISGLKNVGIDDISFNDQNIFLLSNEGEIIRSTDNGSSWSRIENALDTVNINCFTTASTKVFVGTSEDGLFVSADTGQTWSFVSNVAAKNIGNIANSGNSLVISSFAGGLGNCKKYVSTNLGLFWREITGDFNTAQISDFVVDGNFIYAYGMDGLFRSTNAGSNWSLMALDPQFMNIDAVTASGSTMIMQAFRTVNNESYMDLVRSTDYGSNWVPLSIDPLAEILNIRSLEIIDTNIIIGTSNGNILFSNNCGDTWYKINDGLNFSGIENHEIKKIVQNGSDIIITTNQDGIWKRPLQELINISSVEIDQFQPVPAIVYGGYPNPFNPSTTIRYQIPTSGMVKLKIFDIIGREIATLVNENITAGAHEIKWDASAMPSGVYFCRFQYGSTIETKKLMLLK